VVVTDPAKARGAKEKGAEPHVVVLFGAAGDLARRKLLPGLYHVSCSKLAPDIRIIGTSLEDLDDDAFRVLADKACREFSSRKVSEPARCRQAIEVPGISRAAESTPVRRR